MTDERIEKINDFPETSDCFKNINIRGGICYFLWERDNSGLCRICTNKDGKIVSSTERPLLENNSINNKVFSIMIPGAKYHLTPYSYYKRRCRPIVNN